MFDSLEELFRQLVQVNYQNLDQSIISIHKHELTTARKMFFEAFCQPYYQTEDGIKVYDFLIRWYAALRTIVALRQSISDISKQPIEVVDNYLIEFGFSKLLKHLSPTARKTIAENILFHLQQKGTLESIVNLVKLTGLNIENIHHYWLFKHNNEWILRAKQLYTSLATNKTYDFTVIAPLTVVFSDPLWYRTSFNDITDERPIPTPYFSTSFTINIFQYATIHSAVLNALIQKFLITQNSNIHDIAFSYQDVFFDTNIVELTLASAYLSEKLCNFQAIIHPQKTKHLNYNKANINELIEYVTEKIQNDYNMYQKIPYMTREDVQTAINQFYTDFYKSGIYTITQNYTFDELKQRNTAFAEWIENNQTKDVLKRVIETIDVYIYQKTRLLPIFTLSFFNYSDTTDALLKEIINFAKPYHAEFISFFVRFILSDVPGDVTRVTSKLGNIYNSFYFTDFVLRFLYYDYPDQYFDAIDLSKYTWDYINTTITYFLEDDVNALHYDYPYQYFDDISYKRQMWGDILLIGQNRPELQVENILFADNINIYSQGHVINSFASIVEEDNSQRTYDIYFIAQNINEPVVFELISNNDTIIDTVINEPGYFIQKKTYNINLQNTASLIVKAKQNDIDVNVFVII